MDIEWLIEDLAQPALAWLQSSAVKLITPSATADDFAIASAQVRRRVGSDVIADKTAPHDVGQLPVVKWTVADAARVWLVLQFLSGKKNRAALLRDAYRFGDEPERAAILRGLMWIDPQGEAVEMAIEACRVNSLSLFSAIALHNAYPSHFFPERSFNQLCVKSLFQGLSLTDFIGLPERANADLSRICFDYAHERIDANRAIPASLWLALAPHGDEAAVNLLLEYLQHPEPEHRFHAALAISHSAANFATHKNAINMVLAAESEPSIKSLLTNALQS